MLVWLWFWAAAAPVVDEHAATDVELARCAELGDGPVTIAWTVVDGRVREPVLQGEPSASGGCVVGRLLTWTFPTDGAMQRTFVFIDPATTTAVSTGATPAPVAVPATDLAANLLRPRVLIQDTGVVVELLDEAGVSVPLDALEPAVYQMIGTFSVGQPIVMGDVRLEYGDVATVRCNRKSLRCKAKIR